jgi:uncharacterized protein YpuA (DUF1002 family)
MSNKDLSKKVLNVVKNKTGKNVTAADINKLAGKVKPSTMQSEAQLRQLIKQVSSMVKVPVSEQTVNDIVKAVKASGGNANNMEQLIKMISKK